MQFVLFLGLLRFLNRYWCWRGWRLRHYSGRNHRRGDILNQRQGSRRSGGRSSSQADLGACMLKLKFADIALEDLLYQILDFLYVHGMLLAFGLLLWTTGSTTTINGPLFRAEIGVSIENNPLNHCFLSCFWVFCPLRGFEWPSVESNGGDHSIIDEVCQNSDQWSVITYLTTRGVMKNRTF